MSGSRYQLPPLATHWHPSIDQPNTGGPGSCRGRQLEHAHAGQSAGSAPDRSSDLVGSLRVVELDGAGTPRWANESTGGSIWLARTIDTEVTRRSPNGESTSNRSPVPVSMDAIVELRRPEIVAARSTSASPGRGSEKISPASVPARASSESSDGCATSRQRPEAGRAGSTERGSRSRSSVNTQCGSPVSRRSRRTSMYRSSRYRSREPGSRCERSATATPACRSKHSTAVGGWMERSAPRRTRSGVPPSGKSPGPSTTSTE